MYYNLPAIYGHVFWLCVCKYTELIFWLDFGHNLDAQLFAICISVKNSYSMLSVIVKLIILKLFSYIIIYFSVTKPGVWVCIVITG